MLNKKINLNTIRQNSTKEIRTYEEAEKQKGGRPKKDNKANKEVKLYLTEEEYNQIVQIAQANKTTIGRFIKNYFFNDLKARSLLK